MTVIEVGFHQKPKDPGPEPLRMEHFNLPLGIWMVGLLISLFCFLAEIMVNRGRKTKNMATQEDPAVTKLSPESEVPDKACVTFQQEVHYKTEVQVQDTEH